MHVQITAGKALQRSFSEKLETSLSLSVLPKSSWQTLICTLWEIKLSWQVSVGSAHYWRAVCIGLTGATSLCLWKTVFISTCSSSLRAADALREPRSQHAALWVIIPGNRPQTACRCHGAVAQVSAASPQQERNRFGGWGRWWCEMVRLYYRVSECWAAYQLDHTITLSAGLWAAKWSFLIGSAAWRESLQEQPCWLRFENQPAVDLACWSWSHPVEGSRCR